MKESKRAHPRLGVVHLTHQTLAVLERLYQAWKASQHSATAYRYPFVDMRGTNYQTLLSLQNRDMIVAHSIGGSTYALTRRGQMAYELFAEPRGRRDGICPQCGERPRAQRSNGTLFAYCMECKAKNALANYHLRRRYYKTDKKCARCGKRPRRVSRGGLMYSLCEKCLREKHRRQRKARIAKVKAGAVIRCSYPGCTEPVKVVPSTVHQYCEAHLKDYLRRQREKQRNNEGQAA